MKSLIRKMSLIICILLTCVLLIGCLYKGTLTKYEIKMDSLNTEYYFSVDMFNKYDSLYYVEQNNNNVIGMAECHDSAKYYLMKMIKEYNEIITFQLSAR